MKKLVSILLLLGLCLGVLASCGPDEEVIGFDVFNAFNEEYAPTTIKTVVDYVYTDADGVSQNLSGSYETIIEGDKSVLTFSYEKLATIEEMVSGSRFVTVSGNIYKSGNQVSSDGDTWEDATALPGSNFTISLKPEYFASYQLSNDDNTLCGVVNASNVKDVFGTAVSADGDITLTVNGNGERITGIEVSYKTASGANVIIRTSYTYSPVTVTIPA